MTLLFAIASVSCISWIITREELFADLRTWAKGKKGLYPLQCVYCLMPWVAALVCVGYQVPLMQYFAVVWGSYLNVALLAKVRG